MIFAFFRDFSTHYSIAICSSRSSKVLSLRGPKSTQHKKVVCNNCTAHVSDKPVPSRPGTPEQAESPLEYRDIGFDTGPKVSELFVNPGAFHHLKDRYPSSLCKGDVLYPIHFSSFEVCLGGKAAIACHLPGKAPIDFFLAIHKWYKHGSV